MYEKMLSLFFTWDWVEPAGVEWMAAANPLYTH